MVILHSIIDFKRLLLTNHDYTIGRSDADFVISDRSVSRLHAKVCVSYPNEAVYSDNCLQSDLIVTDVSRFGTFLNGNRLAANVAISVPSGSEITVGAMPGVTLV